MCRFSRSMRGQAFSRVAGLPVSTDVAWFVGMGANILVLLACGAVFRRSAPRSFEKAAGSVDHSQHRRVSASLYGRQGSRRMTILWLCWEQLLWEWSGHHVSFCGPTCSIEPKSKRRRLRAPFLACRSRLCRCCPSAAGKSQRHSDACGSIGVGGDPLPFLSEAAGGTGMREGSRHRGIAGRIRW